MSAKPRFTAIVGLALLTLCAAAGARGQGDDRWTKTYTLSGKPEMRIGTNDGHIRVDTWDRNEVAARVHVRGWSIGAGRDVRISERQDGNRVELDVRTPRSAWGVSFQSRSVQIEISMPRQAALSATSGDGHIQVDGLEGTLYLRSGDGHITLTGVRGAMELYTGDGRIEGDRLDGPLQAQTGDGSIRVSGRFDSLALRTGDGHIQADVHTGSRLTATWSLRTSDGSIRLRLRGNIQADLEAHTGDGRINLDIPVEVVGRLSRSDIRGRMNGGGPALRLRTGDGSITIARL
jgi:hypothetical protein